MRAEWVKAIRRATVENTHKHFLSPPPQGQIERCPLGTWQPQFSPLAHNLSFPGWSEWSEIVNGNHY